jgi:3-phosphoshikimate 1-carboxyvinyltransferase
MDRTLVSREIAGRIRAPASKSSMQRAVACAMLASGRSRLLEPSLSADSLAALGLAEALGARQGREAGGAVWIEGPIDLGRRTALDLRCGESGLLMRMASAIASLVPAPTRLLASGSLAKRPVSMVAEPLRALGAGCETSAGLPPVLVRGPLVGGRVAVDGAESSQFLTGLLIALAAAPKDSTIEVAGLASRGYVDLTIDTMRAFGVEARRSEDYSRFEIPGGQAYAARVFPVEGDWSGAAFLLVAAATAGDGGGLSVLGLDPDSSQPDRAITAALAAAGASVEPLGSGEAGLLVRGGAALHGFDFDARDCPDLFPPLVALAASCEGDTRLRGVSRLRAKESDRGAALAEVFGKIGIIVNIEADELVVRGGRVSGGRASSWGDHRIAMTLAVASLVAEGPVVVEGAECVAKSWPGFFEDLDAVSRSPTRS